MQGALVQIRSKVLDCKKEGKGKGDIPELRD